MWYVIRNLVPMREGEGEFDERESSDYAFFLASIHIQVRIVHCIVELKFKAREIETKL